MATKLKRNGKKWNGKTIALIVLAVLVVAAAVVAVVLLTGGPAEKQHDGTVFATGVSVGGIDVSGMTGDEARPMIEEAAEKQLAELTVTYDVDGQEYTLGQEQLGAAADVDTVIAAALAYVPAEEETKDFPIAMTADRETILESLAVLGENYNTEPRNAEIQVEKKQDEDSLTCSESLTFTEGVKGNISGNKEAIQQSSR